MTLSAKKTAIADGRRPIPALQIVAPAKINLNLHVMGRRADGYHLLDSLIAFADMGDVVTVVPAIGLHLTITGPFASALPADGDNLVLRAARSLLAQNGAAGGGTGKGEADEVDADTAGPGAAITLTKNLPVAAGLGGGSADAAAALRALNALWRLELPAATLSQLGVMLGADVPVCLFGRCARIGGIGEQIVAAPPLPAMWLVLVNPGVKLSTAEIFRNLAAGPATNGSPAGPAPAWHNLDGLVALLKETANDLVVPACRMAPVIGQVLETLDDQTGCLLSRMSGSGATCFGLFADPAGAEAAAAAIAGRHDDWWTQCATFLPDAPEVATLA